MGDHQSFENLLHELKELLKDANFQERAQDVRRTFKDEIPRRTLYELESVEDLIAALCSQDAVTPHSVSKLSQIASLFGNKEAADLVSVYRKLSQPYTGLGGNACSCCDRNVPREITTGVALFSLPAADDVALIKAILYLSEHFAPLWKKLVRELPVKMQVPERDIRLLERTKCVERQDATCHQCACFEALNFWRKSYPKSASVKVLRDAAVKDACLKEISDVLNGDDQLEDFDLSSRCVAIRCGLHRSKLAEGPISVHSLVHCLTSMDQW